MNYYKSNPWKGRVIIATLSITIVLGIVRLALPQSIIYGATSWLKSQNIDATIEDIDINIFDGTVSLINAKGYLDGNQLFNVGLIDIHWRWAPLSEKTAVVTKVELDNLAVNIEHYSDRIIIGGVHIPLNIPADANNADTETEDLKPEDVKAWAASLGEVIFTNLNVCYQQDTSTLAAANKKTRYIDYCVDLDEMSWSGTISYGTDPALLKTDDLALSSTGDFKLNGLTVTDNKLEKQLLSSASNTLSNVVISGLNKIHIDTLEMNSLSALHRDDKDHEDAVRFKRLLIDDIRLSDLSTLKIKSLSLDETGLFIVKLNQTDWEYMQWLPSSSSAATKDKSSAQQKTEPSAFKFFINDIQISNSDFCYLESDNNIYYCFNQDELTWKGSIHTATGTGSSGDLKLSIDGDLSASKTKIYNPELNRDLVNIQSISLNKLNIASINEVSFDDLTVDNFSALQRGEKTDDNTASFSRLTANKARYAENEVSINTIKLDGLASHVSKNKDGSWEFDKWQPDNRYKTDTASRTEKETSTTKDKPLLISINKADIKTDKEILFIDNSTKPTMTIGLSKLEFNIHDLNSSRPDTDSTFKLSAKTKRHSTIDLAGTVRPYADKVSLDAKGKLKGFDLRAASPATEKAIGHSIKSGQLDADLTLLAKEGKLDSNVALSLYHFNIKAKSKEDAEKLDKKFGMPLNQTLVLLRDKDDSIHLDIPVTGDVNNPDFNTMDAIIKATSKAATVTLITFYTPYGLAYFGGSALFDIATALDFKPIIFKPGSAVMPEDGKDQLKNMTRLLKEKPQVHLTLCGVTNTSDVYILYPGLKDKSEEKDKNIPLDKEQKEALKKLAKDRQINSKKYLVEKAGIEHDRLILCAPEHNTDEDAIAGVEINI